MYFFSRIADKIIPENLSTQVSGEATENNYKVLRRVLWVAMLTLALGPMGLTAAISYKNYTELLQIEEKGQVEWRLDGSVKNLTAMIGNVHSIINFIAQNDRYTGLLSDRELQILFARVKDEYNYITDIGVIDFRGIQQNYVGPHRLIGDDYGEEPWFREVLRTGVYTSPVYLGHRDLPHFAIAVSKFDPITGKPWILRVTISGTALSEIIETIKTKESEDLFLISADNILQTPSSLFGEVLEPYKRQIIEDEIEEDDNSSEITHIQRRVEGTPWSLVLSVKKYVAHDEWVSFGNHLILTLSICFWMSILSVYILVRGIKTLIRRADKMRMSLLIEAEHTDKLASIGRLAAGVGHEINNPLAIINQKNGLAEDLLAISPDFEQKKIVLNCLKSINQNTDRCKAITHRLLGFARRGETEFEKVQVNDVIEDVLSFLDNSIVHSKITLTKNLAPNLTEVQANHMQLQQVFLNITNNAIDTIGRDGNIDIHSYCVSGDVRVTIQDSGAGIEEEHLAHIFEPFFTTKEAGQGTGLGLSITYGIIKKMGGDITVRSNIGVGTAFTITLPMYGTKNDTTE